MSWSTSDYFKDKLKLDINFVLIAIENHKTIWIEYAACAPNAVWMEAKIGGELYARGATSFSLSSGWVVKYEEYYSRCKRYRNPISFKVNPRLLVFDDNTIGETSTGLYSHNFNKPKKGTTTGNILSIYCFEKINHTIS
jgi:hypothetical protein